MTIIQMQLLPCTTMHNQHFKVVKSGHDASKIVSVEKKKDLLEATKMRIVRASIIICNVKYYSHSHTQAALHKSAFQFNYSSSHSFYYIH